METLHHIAIAVSDIEKAVNWYQSRFDLEAVYVDESWVLLQFESIGLALVLLGQHPSHIAIGRKSVESYGLLTAHRDGIAPVYIQAPMGNSVEIMKADR
jgi:catechol 2,3-dioxygenase-like lactoylglutathione lyase family enzyme